MHNSLPILHSRNGVVFTTSYETASYFEKDHFHLLRDADKLFNSLKSLHPNLDAYMTEVRGEIDLSGRAPRYYELTRKGFTLLAMGFEGKKALDFKVAYLEQFDAMEEALRVRTDDFFRFDNPQSQPEKITAAQRFAFQQEKLRLEIEKVALKQTEFQARSGFKLLDHARRIPDTESMQRALMVSTGKLIGHDLETQEEKDRARASWTPKQIAAQFPELRADDVRAIAKEFDMVKGIDYHPAPTPYQNKNDEVAGINDDARKYYQEGIDKMRARLEQRSSEKLNRKARAAAKRAA